MFNCNPVVTLVSKSNLAVGKSHTENLFHLTNSRDKTRRTTKLSRTRNSTMKLVAFILFINSYCLYI